MVGGGCEGVNLLGTLTDDDLGTLVSEFIIEGFVFEKALSNCLTVRAFHCEKSSM